MCVHGPGRYVRVREREILYIRVPPVVRTRSLTHLPFLRNKPALQHVVRGSVAHRVLTTLGRLIPSQSIGRSTARDNDHDAPKEEEDEEHNMMAETAEDETAKKEEAATLQDESKARSGGR